MFAGQFIQGGVEATRLEGLARLDLLTALPPLCVGVRENVLRGGLRRSMLLILLDLILEL